MNIFNLNHIYLAILLLFLFVFEQTKAQQQDGDINLTDTLNAEPDFFSSETPLKITLISDFKKLRQNKSKGEYQAAELIYFQGDSNEMKRQVKIKARGKNRLENCYYPPIKIAFKSKNSDSKSEFNALKMVVKCDNLPKYQNYLLKEYLCYKLYNVLTDTCFKVRLIDFTYVDTGRKKQEPMKMLSFLIEDDKMLADRFEMNLVKQEKLTQRSISNYQIMRFAMFQFMIANYDWAVPIQQNLKVLESKEYKRRYFAVPYDFDYCGLVGADYAIPGEAIGIQSVKERIYLGECKPENAFLPIIKLYDSKKEQFFNTINDFVFLEQSEKDKMISYLEEFYTIIHDKDFYKNFVQKTCKEIK